MKIPIYRAKKINNDEYVIGFYVFSNIDRDTHLIRIDETYWEDTGLVYSEVEIDPSTLAIHFPDMLDRKGNKIFASLSEDGKGGDIVNIFGKGICYLTFDINGAYATIVDNTANIFDDIFPFSESLTENDIGIITGIKQ